ncbi:hypothetical protein AGMMS50284_2910 [Clostridia bacterium]|nr:hypothetical protein AGMMS50284_2910 [Clostridia bacterium]
MQVYDANTGFTPKLGFSIKSRLGQPSTLLNAGKTTNFVYEICGGITDSEMLDVNRIIDVKERNGKINSDIPLKKRLNYIKKHDFSFSFVKMECETFQNNLILIDSDLPKIVAEMLTVRYFNDNRKVLDILDNVSYLNPLNYDLSQGHQFYHYKFKKMITESALGMIPSKVWTGHADANGGYIVVREDGEVLCYHLYNRNEFEEYLMKNVKFETPSANRYNFGTIYKDNGKYYIKLNLQIRFLK